MTAINMQATELKSLKEHSIGNHWKMCLTRWGEW